MYTTWDFLCIFSTLPYFWIHIPDPHPKFHYVIINEMDGEVILIIGDPSLWVITIKIVRVHFRKVIPYFIIHGGWFMVVRIQRLLVVVR
jgi:hypothetical protein